MNSFVIALAAGVFYVIAYHTYGRFLGRKIFKIDSKNVPPSEELRDDVDYVPTWKEVLFGHHFASIAGTGPIVGPAIAVIWGWLPALLWVLIGSVIMGAVHDYGSLVVSMRNQGRSIGDLAGDIITKRVRLLMLIIIFFGLLIVVAIFGVVIAAAFNMYPHAVLPIWSQIPIAVTLGWLMYKKNVNPFLGSLIAVVVMYGTVVLGVYFPLKMPGVGPLNPVAVWVVILLIYAYVASILPVHVLLQPRDFINAYQLVVSLALLALGVAVAHPPMVVDAVVKSPTGAPPMLPMLFVVVACGAISGFHSLVSSGTTSKQCDSEGNAQFIGYGAMLMEGMLAVFVIVACAAGLGLGYMKDGELLKGTAAFQNHYASWTAAQGLASKIGAFVTGAKNMVDSLGIPAAISLNIMGVLIVAFAATTLDTATRIQRYIVGELARTCGAPALAKKHPATAVAVVTALALAFCNGSGKGALLLWPLFGCTNQLLAGLALLIVTVYLAKKRCPIVFTALPMVFMVVMTGWATALTIHGFLLKSQWLLFGIGSLILVLELWMIVESVVVLKKIYGDRKRVRAE